MMRSPSAGMLMTSDERANRLLEAVCHIYGRPSPVPGVALRLAPEEAVPGLIVTIAQFVSNHPNKRAAAREIAAEIERLATEIAHTRTDMERGHA